MGHNSVTNININLGGGLGGLGGLSDLLGGGTGGANATDPAAAQQALDSAAQKAGANIDDVNAGAKALGLDKGQLSNILKNLPPELQQALMKALEQTGKESESPLQKFLKQLEDALKGAQDQQQGAQGAGGAGGGDQAGGADQASQGGKIAQDLLQLFKDLLGGAGGADTKAGGTNPFGGDHFNMTQTTVDTDMAPNLG